MFLIKKAILAGLIAAGITLGTIGLFGQPTKSNLSSPVINSRNRNYGQESSPQGDSSPCNCQVITKCLSLSNGQSIRGRFCGFDGFQRKVCCNNDGTGIELTESQKQEAQAAADLAKFYRNPDLYKSEDLLNLDTGQGQTENLDKNFKSQISPMDVLDFGPIEDASTTKSPGRPEVTSEQPQLASEVTTRESQSASEPSQTTPGPPETETTTRSSSTSTEISMGMTTEEQSRKLLTSIADLFPDYYENHETEDGNKGRADLDDLDKVTNYKDAESILAQFFPDYYEEIIKNLTAGRPGLNASTEASVISETTLSPLSVTEMNLSDTGTEKFDNLDVPSSVLDGPNTMSTKSQDIPEVSSDDSTTVASNSEASSVRSVQDETTNVPIQNSSVQSIEVDEPLTPTSADVVVPHVTEDSTTTGVKPDDIVSGVTEDPTTMSTHQDWFVSSTESGVTTLLPVPETSALPIEVVTTEISKTEVVVPGTEDPTSLSTNREFSVPGTENSTTVPLVDRDTTVSKEILVQSTKDSITTPTDLDILVPASESSTTGSPLASVLSADDVTTTKPTPEDDSSTTTTNKGLSVPSSESSTTEATMSSVPSSESSTTEATMSSVPRADDETTSKFRSDDIFVPLTEDSVTSKVSDVLVPASESSTTGSYDDSTIRSKSEEIVVPSSQDSSTVSTNEDGLVSSSEVSTTRSPTSSMVSMDDATTTASKFEDIVVPSKENSSTTSTNQDVLVPSSESSSKVSPMASVRLRDDETTTASKPEEIVVPSTEDSTTTSTNPDMLVPSSESSTTASFMGSVPSVDDVTTTTWKPEEIVVPSTEDSTTISTNQDILVPSSESSTTGSFMGSVPSVDDVTTTTWKPEEIVVPSTEDSTTISTNQDILVPSSESSTTGSFMGSVPSVDDVTTTTWKPEEIVVPSTEDSTTISTNQDILVPSSESSTTASFMGSVPSVDDITRTTSKPEEIVVPSTEDSTTTSTNQDILVPSESSTAGSPLAPAQSIDAIIATSKAEEILVPSTDDSTTSSSPDVSVPCSDSSTTWSPMSSVPSVDDVTTTSKPEESVVPSTEDSTTTSSNQDIVVPSSESSTTASPIGSIPSVDDVTTASSKFTDPSMTLVPIPQTGVTTSKPEGILESLNGDSTTGSPNSDDSVSFTEKNKEINATPENISLITEDSTTSSTSPDSLIPSTESTTTTVPSIPAAGDSVTVINDLTTILPNRDESEKLSDSPTTISTNIKVPRQEIQDFTTITPIADDVTEDSVTTSKTSDASVTFNYGQSLGTEILPSTQSPTTTLGAISEPDSPTTIYIPESQTSSPTSETSSLSTETPLVTPLSVPTTTTVTDLEQSDSDLDVGVGATATEQNQSNSIGTTGFPDFVLSNGTEVPTRVTGSRNLVREEAEITTETGISVTSLGGVTTGSSTAAPLQIQSSTTMTDTDEKVAFSPKTVVSTTVKPFTDFINELEQSDHFDDRSDSTESTNSDGDLVTTTQMMPTVDLSSESGSENGQTPTTTSVLFDRGDIKTTTEEVEPSDVSTSHKPLNAVESTKLDGDLVQTTPESRFDLSPGSGLDTKTTTGKSSVPLVEDNFEITTPAVTEKMLPSSVTESNEPIKINGNKSDGDNNINSSEMTTIRSIFDDAMTTLKSGISTILNSMSSETDSENTRESNIEKTTVENLVDNSTAVNPESDDSTKTPKSLQLDEVTTSQFNIDTGSENKERKFLENSSIDLPITLTSTESISTTLNPSVQDMTTEYQVLDNSGTDKASTETTSISPRIDEIDQVVQTNRPVDFSSTDTQNLASKDGTTMSSTKDTNVHVIAMENTPTDSLITSTSTPTEIPSTISDILESSSTTKTTKAIDDSTTQTTISHNVDEFEANAQTNKSEISTQTNKSEISNIITTIASISKDVENLGSDADLSSTTSTSIESQSTSSNSNVVEISTAKPDVFEKSMEMITVLPTTGQNTSDVDNLSTTLSKIIDENDRINEKPTIATISEEFTTTGMTFEPSTERANEEGPITTSTPSTPMSTTFSSVSVDETTTTTAESVDKTVNVVTSPKNSEFMLNITEVFPTKMTGMVQSSKVNYSEESDENDIDGGRVSNDSSNENEPSISTTVTDKPAFETYSSTNSTSEEIRATTEPIWVSDNFDESAVTISNVSKTVLNSSVEIETSTLSSEKTDFDEIETISTISSSTKDGISATTLSTIISTESSNEVEPTTESIKEVNEMDMSIMSTIVSSSSEPFNPMEMSTKTDSKSQDSLENIRTTVLAKVSSRKLEDVEETSTKPSMNQDEQLATTLSTKKTNQKSDQIEVSTTSMNLSPQDPEDDETTTPSTNAISQKIMTTKMTTILGESQDEDSTTTLSSKTTNSKLDKFEESTTSMNLPSQNPDGDETTSSSTNTDSPKIINIETTTISTTLSENQSEDATTLSTKSADHKPDISTTQMSLTVQDQNGDKTTTSTFTSTPKPILSEPSTSLSFNEGEESTATMSTKADEADVTSVSTNTGLVDKGEISTTQNPPSESSTITSLDFDSIARSSVLLLPGGQRSEALTTESNVNSIDTSTKAPFEDVETTISSLSEIPTTAIPNYESQSISSTSDSSMYFDDKQAETTIGSKTLSEISNLKNTPESDVTTKASISDSDLDEMTTEIPKSTKLTSPLTITETTTNVPEFNDMSTSNHSDVKTELKMTQKPTTESVTLKSETTDRQESTTISSETPNPENLRADSDVDMRSTYENDPVDEFSNNSSEIISTEVPKPGMTTMSPDFDFDQKSNPKVNPSEDSTKAPNLILDIDEFTSTSGSLASSTLESSTIIPDMSTTFPSTSTVSDKTGKPAIIDLKNTLDSISNKTGGMESSTLANASNSKTDSTTVPSEMIYTEANTEESTNSGGNGSIVINTSDSNLTFDPSDTARELAENNNSSTITWMDRTTVLPDYSSTSLYEDRTSMSSSLERETSTPESISSSTIPDSTASTFETSTLASESMSLSLIKSSLTLELINMSSETLTNMHESTSLPSVGSTVIPESINVSSTMPENTGESTSFPSIESTTESMNLSFETSTLSPESLNVSSEMPKNKIPTVSTSLPSVESTLLPDPINLYSEMSTITPESTSLPSMETTFAPTSTNLPFETSTLTPESMSLSAGETTLTPESSTIGAEEVITSISRVISKPKVLPDNLSTTPENSVPFDPRTSTERTHSIRKEPEKDKTVVELVRQLSKVKTKITQSIHKEQNLPSSTTAEIEGQWETSTISGDFETTGTTLFGEIETSTSGYDASTNAWNTQTLSGGNETGVTLPGENGTRTTLFGEIETSTSGYDASTNAWNTQTLSGGNETGTTLSGENETGTTLSGDIETTTSGYDASTNAWSIQIEDDLTTLNSVSLIRGIDISKLERVTEVPDFNNEITAKGQRVDKSLGDSKGQSHDSLEFDDNSDTREIQHFEAMNDTTSKDEFAKNSTEDTTAIELPTSTIVPIDTSTNVNESFGVTSESVTDKDPGSTDTTNGFNSSTITETNTETSPIVQDFVTLGSLETDQTTLPSSFSNLPTNTPRISDQNVSIENSTSPNVENVTNPNKFPESPENLLVFSESTSDTPENITIETTQLPLVVSKNSANESSLKRTTQTPEILQTTSVSAEKTFFKSENSTAISEPKPTTQNPEVEKPLKNPYLISTTLPPGNVTESFSFSTSESRSPSPDNTTLLNLFNEIFSSRSAPNDSHAHTHAPHHYPSRINDRKLVLEITQPGLNETNPEAPKSEELTVNIKIGPGPGPTPGARALYPGEANYVESQLQNQISNVVNQLLLTTHENYRLLPSFIECASATRRGRRKTRVLNFDTDNYPWMARIGYQEAGGITFSCAGTIINRRYILTSAYCAFRKPGAIKEVLVESAKHLLSPSDVQYKYGVERVIGHPDYNASSRLNDLALIRLNSDISFNSSSEIKPICLPFEDGYGVWDSMPKVGDEAYVGGWGFEHNHTTKTLTDLKESAVQIWPNENCTKAFEGDMEKAVGPSQICAYASSGNGGCRGDGGAPLMSVMTRHKIFFQIGVVSYGPQCGYKVPRLYTRVSDYLRWILDVMEP